MHTLLLVAASSSVFFALGLALGLVPGRRRLREARAGWQARIDSIQAELAAKRIRIRQLENALMTGSLEVPDEVTSDAASPNGTGRERTRLRKTPPSAPRPILWSDVVRGSERGELAPPRDRVPDSSAARA